MKTYTTLRNLFGSLTNDSSSDNLTLGDQLINDSYRRLCSEREWDFVEKQKTALTVASQQAYDLPYDYERLIAVSVQTGTSQTYVPRECPSQRDWEILNENTSVSSNYPEWYWIYNNQILFYPKPSTAGNTITYTYRRRVIDLSEADYSTGTVSTATNGSTSIVGAGTTWTLVDAGFYIKITPDRTDSTKDGDGFWYGISSVTDNTTIVLTRNYEGTTIGPAAGAAYIIGEASMLPEAYQDIPVYDAAMVYYSTVFPEPDRAAMMKAIRDEKHAQLVADHSLRTLDPVVEDIDQTMVNPNLFIQY